MVGFRLKPEEIQPFEQCLIQLGVTSSELARKAFQKGFNEAVNEMVIEREEGLKLLKQGMVRGGGFEPPTPTVSR